MSSWIWITHILRGIEMTLSVTLPDCKAVGFSEIKMLGIVNTPIITNSMNLVKVTTQQVM